MRLADDTLGVTMRTPGHDLELVVGFLLAEGVVSDAALIGGINHCGRPGQSQNVVNVKPAPGTAFDWDVDRMLRRTSITAACGVCGRVSVDDLMARVQPLSGTDTCSFRPAWVAGLSERLGEHQPNFGHTGGVHAAGLFRPGETDATVREDVGRHNAVDKVIGREALDGRLPLTGSALVVSGRVSFEIIQKALVAGIAMVVSISAPTSLAIHLASEARLTLVSFARGGRFNVYSTPERIRD